MRCYFKLLFKTPNLNIIYAFQGHGTQGEEFAVLGTSIVMETVAASFFRNTLALLSVAFWDVKNERIC